MYTVQVGTRGATANEPQTWEDVGSTLNRDEAMDLAREQPCDYPVRVMVTDDRGQLGSVVWCEYPEFDENGDQIPKGEWA